MACDLRLQQFEQLGLDGDVERRGRLVGNRRCRVAAHPHRDHHALAHAAGELVGIAIHPPARLGNVDRLQQRQAFRQQRVAGKVLVQLERFAELAADGVDRIEARHRLLKDHGDPVAADLAHGRIVGRHEVLIAKADFAMSDPAGRIGDEPQQRQRSCALAAAALPDQREDFTFVQVERHAIDRGDDTSLGREFDCEIAHAEQRLGRGLRHRCTQRRTRLAPRSRGSSASRRPSPTKLKEMIASEIITPGAIENSGAASR